ncbi:MAG: SocA family protein [Candidatus Hydrogenedentes bacterium]|nr:SocA family protein [Candidatus Hydrogenedentota bacterium]
MSFVFSPEKATQVAAFLIKKTQHQRINYLALIKLLYLVDRQSFIEVGFPITGDRHVAMKYGPVLSNVYDLIEDNLTGTDGQQYWSAHIQQSDYDVFLVEDPGDSELSHFDNTIMSQVFAEHGAKDRWQLVAESHLLGEWLEAYRKNTSTDITLESILHAIGKSDQYEEIEQSRKEECYFAELFGDARAN